MVTLDMQAGAKMLRGFLQPWYDALTNPDKAQEEILHRLLQDYAKTGYGKQRGADQIEWFDRLHCGSATLPDWGFDPRI